MKLACKHLGGIALVSHPARGAWIEIPLGWAAGQDTGGSHPARGAWIEILLFRRYSDIPDLSHPARGAWIEMLSPGRDVIGYAVAPRKGCVD